MKSLVFSAVCAVVFGMVSTASATMILTDTTEFYGTYTEDDSSDLISFGGESATYLGDSLVDWVTWVHQFTFDPAAKEILSATLTLTFYDDERDRGLRFWTYEYAFGYAEDGNWDIGEIDSGNYTYDVDASYLADGNFQITLANVGGELQDFYITKSELSIEYQPVPEPATMLLLGTGIAGLAGITRRKKK